MRRFGLYIMVLLLIGQTSCSRYLDVKDKSEVVPKTAEEFSAILHTRLNNIEQASEYAFFGAYLNTLPFEFYTDNMDANLTISERDIPEYVGSDINSLSGKFGSLYVVIKDCNIVLHELKERDTEFGKKLLATAYTMRAVCYYNLMRNFCEPYDKTRAGEQLGVPLVDKFDMEGKPDRASLKATADFIIHDLKEALKLNQTDKQYLFYADVTNAYLARTYFWTQEWDLAASTAKEVLDAYPLIRGDAYREMLQSEVERKGNELIRSGTKQSEAYTRLYMQRSKQRPVSLDLVKLFTEKERDIRYTFFFDEQFLNTKMLKTSVRAAEMCLIMAESYAHAGDETNALRYLNHLRENRISEYVPYTAQNLPEVNTDALVKVDATGKALTPLMSAILNERRKELYLEFDRWYELKRNGSPVMWWGLSGVKYETAKFMYLFPIPKTDIALNSGLIQNPGYEGL